MHGLPWELYCSILNSPSDLANSPQSLSHTAVDQGTLGTVPLDAQKGGGGSLGTHGTVPLNAQRSYWTPSGLNHSNLVVVNSLMIGKCNVTTKTAIKLKAKGSYQVTNIEGQKTYTSNFTRDKKKKKNLKQ